MECLPAIDIRAGRCVRLLQGSYAKETVYGDPVELALDYVAAGASALHIVDLDAARTGEPVNRAIVLEIVRRTGVPVQHGGGIRSAGAAAEALSVGIDKVVLGTFAVEEAEATVELVRRFPGQVVIGLDHRRVVADSGSGSPAPVKREVAVRGWEEGAGLDLFDALALYEGEPVGGVVVTDIGRDGMLEGPDVDGYVELLTRTALPIVASGGVASAADLETLSSIEVEGRRLVGVVVGKALLEGRLTVGEAVAACAV